MPHVGAGERSYHVFYLLVKAESTARPPAAPDAITSRSVGHVSDDASSSHAASARLRDKGADAARRKAMRLSGECKDYKYLAAGDCVRPHHRPPSPPIIRTLLHHTRPSSPSFSHDPSDPLLTRAE